MNFSIKIEGEKIEEKDKIFYDFAGKTGKQKNDDSNVARQLSNIQSTGRSSTWRP
jgi:hypothetical protein